MTRSKPSSTNRRPRIVDVAHLAGVSRTAVSVVLNDRVGEQVRVSEETQQKIWDAVAELGYVANPVAQSLARGRTQIIAVFTFESIFPVDSRNFYYPFLIGIEENADTSGYDLLLVTSSDGGSDGRRLIYQKGVNRLQRADGAILLGHGSEDEISSLLDEKYPFVFVGRRESPQDDISFVAANYTAATVELVNYLVQNGHRRLAYLRSTRHTEASADREQGVRQAIAAHQLPPPPNWLWEGTPETFTDAVLTDFLAQNVTAFVAEDDELGHRLLAIAAQSGLSCPDDFSLAVLGNPLNPASAPPNWTSFTIPRRQMGREAFALLLELLALPPEKRQTPLRRWLPCHFKPGETVRPV
jgi:DNA-binding LacI/PurR family transcriptional regulator